MSKKKNHKPKNNKGMTLVEVIVSIALLGIITAMVFLILSAGILLSYNSGDNTKVTGESSGILENALGGAEITNGPGDELQVSGVTIGEGKYEADAAANAVVQFSGTETETVPGSLVTVYSESDNNNTTMAAFIPD